MATMQQVAERANVSISTVSFVVNGTKPVLPETRQRILDAIDALGYRRNAVARALAARRTRTICLVYPLRVHDLTTFVEAATAAAGDHGYSLTLRPVHEEDAADEVSSLIQTGIADGVLLLEVQLDDERVARLQAAGAPFAMIGRTRDPAGIDFVDIDFERTVGDAVDELVGLGHRAVALVLEDFRGTSLAAYGPPVRVETGFRAAAARHGLDAPVLHVPRTTDAEQGLAGRLLAATPAATAVVCLHDRASVALVNGLRRRGVRVPDELSVVAIAAPWSIASLADPPLVNFDAPGAQLGRAAAEALIARLEGADGPRAQLLIPCVRTDGGSVGPAPALPAPRQPSV